MSKAALLVLVPVVVGLAAWNVVLSSEVDELRSRVADAVGEESSTSRPARQETSPSPREAAPRADPASSRLADLEKRLAAVEKAPPSAPPAAGALSAGGAGGPVVVDPDSEAFRAAVERTLDGREEKRRVERRERMAENIARGWFRDLTLTDAQRTNALRVIADSLAKAEEVRGDETLSEETRRQEIQRVQTERLDALSTILDAAQMETVRSRTDGRARGPRREERRAETPPR